MKKQIAALFLALGGLAPAWGAEADWPMFQYNSQHQGRVAERQAIKQPKVLWKAPVGVTGWLNSPVIAEGLVFVGSAGTFWNMPDYEGYDAPYVMDGVLAFELESGKRKWYQPADNDVNQVVYEQGLVIATGAQQQVWALEAQTGKKRWSVPLKGEGYQLLVHNGQVIVGDGKGQLLWLEAKTGKVLARTQLDSAIRAGASSDGERIFAATVEGTIYAFDLKGNLQWKESLRTLYPELIDPDYPLRPEIYGAPTVFQDLLVIGFARDTLYETPALLALDRKNGKLRWKASSDDRTSWGNIRTSPAVFDNYLIYAEPYSNTVAAFDGQTGKHLGDQTMGLVMFPQWSSPALAGDTLYIPRFDGGLYAVDAKKGDLQWQFYIGNPDLAGAEFPQLWKELGYEQQGHWKPPIGDAVYASPAIAANGQILIPAAGYLYCIGEQK